MSYKFSKSDGGPIPRAQAETWIEAYKKKHPDGPRAFFFGSDIIEDTLRQPGAVGLRIYLGYDQDKLQTMLIAANESGGDVWGESAQAQGGGQTAGDNSKPCPPYCP